MRVSDKGLAEIASHEGVVLSPYKDSVGVWTFGIGHTASAGIPDPRQLRGEQSLAFAMDVFRRDIAHFEGRVNRAVKVPIKQHQFDALVSFDFNTGGINRASLTKALNAGSYTRAAELFMRWTKPKEVEKRRGREMRLFRDGVYSSGGKATVYRAVNGNVQWASGKRIDVMSAITGIDEDLLAVQTKLAAKGYDVVVDGKDDSETVAAIKAFQMRAGLDADGVAGPKTRAALDLPGNEAARAPVAGKTPTPKGKTRDKPKNLLARLLEALAAILKILFGAMR